MRRKQRPSDIITCRGCGLKQRRDKFPKMNVQYGRQYYRSTCGKCVYKAMANYQKNHKRTAAALVAQGKKPPGRPRRPVEPFKTCTKCGETKPVDMFGRKYGPHDERRHASCKACKAKYLSEYRATTGKRSAPRKSTVDFNGLMMAFRPTHKEQDNELV